MPKFRAEDISEMLVDEEVRRTEEYVTKFAEIYQSLGNTEKQMVSGIAEKWQRVAAVRAAKLDNDELEYEGLRTVLGKENIEIQTEILPFFPFVVGLTGKELDTAVNGFVTFMFRKSKAN